MAAHQAPPSLGFSRQEHWSGLPFPSPMHESEKWKKLLSRVLLLATPWTAAYQAPPSLGFSRQEYWSRLPFPSPMHESEKWKKLLSCVWLLATPWTATYQAPPSMGFSRQEYWSGMPLPSLVTDEQRCKNPQQNFSKQNSETHQKLIHHEQVWFTSGMQEFSQFLMEWVAISFSNAWKWRVKVKLLSHVWLLATPWTAAHQAPLSMGFSRQEYWSGSPVVKMLYAL